MTTRLFILSLIVTVVIGITIAFLWVQVELPNTISSSPWNSQVYAFPSLYALWIPLIYLFFTGIWFYCSRKSLDDRERIFLRFDHYSYLGVLVFFVLQIFWKDLGSPIVWLRGAVLGILLFKSFLLFRTLYHSPQRIQPVLLIILGIGLHIFLFGFVYQKLSLSITHLSHRTELVQLAIITIKSLGLNVMTLEMFRLGVEMAKSVQSAFFSWLIVTFTFPIIGFPKISYILAGLLIIFVLRMIFSRLDTRELMLGLVTPTNIMILLKLLVVLAVLAAAGIVFWGNVKPGFEFRSGRALQAAIGTLFDGQAGLLCYSPVYWFAFFGVIYLLFFKVWDGILLIITGGTLYIGYHLAVYGILGRVAEQNDIVPFIPFLGVFIAIAYSRFRKMVLFRFGVRLAIVVTAGITALLILLHPHFTLISAKVAEIQQAVTSSLGKDITYIVPSTVFRLFSLSFFVWTGIIIVVSLFFCNNRTRSVSLITRRIRHTLEQYFDFQEFSFFPCLLFILLMAGTLIIQYGDKRYVIPIDSSIQLSHSQPQKEITITNAPDSKGILIVSHLTGSPTIVHKTPIANISAHSPDQRFESFSMKAGKDTSEETLDRSEIKEKAAHGRATLYHSWSVDAGDGMSFMAHDYLTKFSFSKPLNVQKITFKLLDPKPEETPPQIVLHIKEIALIH